MVAPHRLIIVALTIVSLALLSAGTCVYVHAPAAGPAPCPSCSTPSCLPCTAGFNLSNVTAASSGSTYWYNMTITGVDANLSAANLHPWLDTTNASFISPTFNVTLVNASGCAVAAYGFGEGMWRSPSVGGCPGLTPYDPIFNREVLSISSPTNLTGEGFTFSCGITYNTPGGENLLSQPIP
jgi:hypothetical protein